MKKKFFATVMAVVIILGFILSSIGEVGEEKVYSPCLYWIVGTALFIWAIFFLMKWGPSVWGYIKSQHIKDQPLN